MLTNANGLTVKFSTPVATPLLDLKFRKHQGLARGTYVGQKDKRCPTLWGVL